MMTLRDIEHKLERMDESAHVDYLLDVIHALIEAQVDVHPVDRVTSLTRSQRKVVQVLYDNAGRIVSQENILSGLCVGRAGDWPDLGLIPVHICKIRKKLPKEIGSIRTHSGLGYEFIKAKETSNVGTFKSKRNQGAAGRDSVRPEMAQ
jgi:DNA-binding response OmpR family regulator